MEKNKIKEETATCSRSVPSVRYGFCGRKRVPLGPKHVVIWTKPEIQYGCDTNVYLTRQTREGKT